MNKTELEKELTTLFPEFCKYWDSEDIYREEDNSFLSHGLMTSFYHFFRDNFDAADVSDLKKFCEIIEDELKASSDGEIANAICTSFFELISDTKAGDALEPYLEKTIFEYVKRSWNP